MLIAQLGESANELVQKWGKGPYRYGFPDQYAAEFPVRPMAWDQSRIYSGIIGRHYPNAETERYHYAYDPNMYMQPGFGAAGMSADEAIKTFKTFVMLAQNSFPSFDVVFDTGTSTGAYIDYDNKLWVVHGATIAALQQATAAAGGVFNTQTPNSDLAKRITEARVMDPTIVPATIGKVEDVRNAAENMLAALQAGSVKPLPVTPIVVAPPAPATAASLSTLKLSKTTWIAIAAGTAVLAAGTATAILLKRRRTRGY